VALDSNTGDVLAMVGGGDYQRSTFNRATRGQRQPGSTFKPFVYATALEKGYSPVSVLTQLDAVTAPAPGEMLIAIAAPTNASHRSGCTPGAY
jgi:penicillin-binding protein 1A